jgi:type IV fimbrial biogenesis protein FimT
VLRLSAPSRGFSIIEVMIALAIVAMLLMLVAPSTATWIQNTRLRSAAESVSSGLQLARIEAMKRNTYVSFQLTDPNSTAWQVCIYNPVTDLCSPAAGSVLQTRSVAEASINTALGTDTVLSNPATALVAGTNVPSSATFDSFGRLAATAVSNIMRVDVRSTVLSATDERRLVIFINLGGQVRMCDPKLVKATNPQGCQ